MKLTVSGAANNMISEQVENQYNLAARRGNLDSVIENWLAHSKSYRSSADVVTDFAYGSGERDKFDYFSSGTKDTPLLVYLHGGYWQRGDKSIYSFLAKPFVESGINVAIVNYDLCPDVRIGEIAPQIRRAITGLWHVADKLNFCRDQIYVMGHSAGGHLTAMMLNTDWTFIDPLLPCNTIAGGIPISGVFDLQPLLQTSLNNALKMEIAEARAESPLLIPMTSNAPQLVIVGGGETDAFKNQSEQYCKIFQTEKRRMQLYIEADVDHFDVINRLAERDGQLFKQVLGFIKQSR